MDGDYVVAGEAAGGWVRVELTGDGRLRDLVLDDRVTSLRPDDLRDALVSAILAAQDDLASAISDTMAAHVAGGSFPARAAGDDAFPAQVADVMATAERRFAELSTALYDITRKAGRPW